LNKEAGHFSEEFKSLMTLMLQYEAYNRPNISEVIGHPWLAGGDAPADFESIQSEFERRM
jgi:hypothetical protein